MASGRPEQISETEAAIAICRIFLALEELHTAGLRDAYGARVRRETVHYLWELRRGGKYDEARPHSLAARLARRNKRPNLAYEHSIPAACFMPILRASATDPRTFLGDLHRLVKPVIILEEEHSRLHDLGLGSRMPPGSRVSDSLARYHAAKILVEEKILVEDLPAQSRAPAKVLGETNTRADQATELLGSGGRWLFEQSWKLIVRSFRARR